MLVIVGWSISCEIDLRWISLDPTVSMEGNGLEPSRNPFWIFMEPPTMLLVPICRDMQLWWDNPPIPSPRNCMPGDTCFDDVGRNCACVTWTQMYVTLQTKKCFPFKSSHYSFFYIRAAGRRARSARRPAVQNVSVIAQGHGGGHASPIEAAGQWFY